MRAQRRSALSPAAIDVRQCVIFKPEGKLTMEGFWTVQFKGVQGFGTGVVTYIGGRVFGGDSAVMFTGTYNLEGNAVTMKLHVKQMVPGLVTVMGGARNTIWI